MNVQKHVSRRNVLRGAALLAGFAATGSAVTACSASSAGSTASKSGGLTIMSKAGEITKGVIDAWLAEHPDVPITLIEDDPTRLNAMLAAGTPPDLVRGLGATSTANIASRGLALDLDPYLAKSSVLKESELAKINDVWRWDGTRQGEGAHFGLVKDWSQDAMFWYNVNAFKEAGIPLPTADKPLRYDQLLEYSAPMTKRGGGKVEQYGLFTTAPTIEAISAMVATTSGRVFNDDLSKVDFTSPEAMRALQWFIDVAKAKTGYTLLDPNPDGWDWPPFDAKRIAMAAAGYWFGGAVAQNPKTAEFARLAPAPMLGSKRVSPATSATGHWISAKSNMKDEAYAFLEWYSAGAPAKTRAQSGWGLPAVTSLATELPQSQPYQSEALAVQKNEEQYLQVISFSPYAQTTAVSAAIANLFPRAVDGSLSAGQFADQTTTAVNDLLKQGMELAGKKG
ncbi:extracellular solute-binding protein [Arthrobacter sp. ISL-30]|uniref:extracellular solute-binding protein n=1 Tax=Arthrobacter sp. ISL-30 TaxID=2819109 RepID=UPI001BE84072|nr:extracellular solute-binding protein [Arthrobacter sp. ISL-30]MBT2513695.1 extracellular solute-binding protein [Arthrobacter sp. ISL-30]